MLGANTNKVLKGLLGLLIGLAPRDNTVDDVLGKLVVLAVAGSVRGILAVCADLEPSVHALRKDRGYIARWRWRSRRRRC
jgi:hypothetical protein